MEMNASQSQNRDPVNTITSPTGFQYSFSPFLTPSQCGALVWIYTHTHTYGIMGTGGDDGRM